MLRTRFALLSAALLLSLSAATALAAGARPAPAATKAAVAPPIPGVGYDPHARGLSVSIYQLDTLTSPLQHYSAVFSADPGAVGVHPDPYYLNISDPLVRAAYELRWGPNTAGTRFKRWIGPGNEARAVLRDALVWYLENRPGDLGGSTAGRNGEPTEVEITDVQALNDAPIWVGYLQGAVVGYSPDHRETINDPNRHSGDGQEPHPFWKITWYYHNTYEAPPPFSPQSPTGVN
ncbi:MAG TPA: hypothetical protein VGS22_09530 [Thermoanaerobaculia bacterium]|jgi:hypothetical protein|nr:hypothetical protein [Thermoanaerobaculia bacterium]